MAKLTLEAYARDLRQFLDYVAARAGRAAALQDLSDLTQADVRAFMAARRSGGAGSRTLLRGLAGVRSFVRFSSSAKPRAQNFGLLALSDPQNRASPAQSLVGRRCARSLRPRDARRREKDQALDSGARCRCCVPALRGGTAHFSGGLALQRGDAPVGRRDVVVVRAARGARFGSAPVIEPVRRAIQGYLDICPYELAPDGPLFVGARGGRCRHGLSSLRSNECVGRSVCRTPLRRMRCVTLSRRTCSVVAATSGRSRNCSGMRRYRRPRYTRR